MGGLALLVLITAVLYKVKHFIQYLIAHSHLQTCFDNLALNSQVGFFKSKYKKMIDDTAGEEANLETGNTPSPEQM